MKFLTNSEMVFNFPEKQKIELRVLIEGEVPITIKTTAQEIYNLAKDNEFITFFNMYIDIIYSKIKKDYTLLLVLDSLISKEETEEQFNKLGL